MIYKILMYLVVMAEVLLGGFWVMCASCNLVKGSYFKFGVDVMLSIYMAALMVYHILTI